MTWVEGDSPGGKKLWLVSSGEYSDYSVACVCSTEEVAVEVAHRMSLGWQNNPQYRTKPWLNRYEVEEIGFAETPDDVCPDPGNLADPEST